MFRKMTQYFFNNSYINSCTLHLKAGYKIISISYQQMIRHPMQSISTIFILQTLVSLPRNSALYPEMINRYSLDHQNNTFYGQHCALLTHNTSFNFFTRASMIESWLHERYVIISNVPNLWNARIYFVGNCHYDVEQYQDFLYLNAALEKENDISLLEGYSRTSGLPCHRHRYPTEYDIENNKKKIESSYAYMRRNVSYSGWEDCDTARLAYQLLTLHESLAKIIVDLNTIFVKQNSVDFSKEQVNKIKKDLIKVSPILVQFEDLLKTKFKKTISLINEIMKIPENRLINNNHFLMKMSELNLIAITLELRERVNKITVSMRNKSLMYTINQLKSKSTLFVRIGTAHFIPESSHARNMTQRDRFFQSYSTKKNDPQHELREFLDTESYVMLVPINRSNFSGC